MRFTAGRVAMAALALALVSGVTGGFIGALLPSADAGTDPGDRRRGAGRPHM